jgi:hypothetical protein
MLALLSVVSIVFSLAQFIRSSCAEPPATKSNVIEAVRQELQRIDDAAADTSVTDDVKQAADAAKER